MRINRLIGFVAAVSLTVVSFLEIGTVNVSAQENEFEIEGTKLIRYNGNSKEVIVPSDITEIGERAFNNCWETEKIVLPENLKIIDPNAFSKCDNLKSLKIPAHVEQIGWVEKGNSGWYSANAFGYCPKIESIDVDTDNQRYTSKDGVLFYKENTTGELKVLVYYPAGRKAAEYKIPDTIEMIHSGAFHQSENLQNITISKSVKFIGNDRNFEESKKHSTLEDNYKYSENQIGEWFIESKSLKNVYVDGENRKFKDEDGVVFSKDGKALLCCPPARSSEKYSIPDGVTYIGNYSFCSYRKLKELYIPKSVTSIIGEDRKVIDCTSLFIGCINLEKVEVADDNPEYSSLDGVLYSKNKDTLYFYPANKRVEKFVIPDIVVMVGGFGVLNQIDELIVTQNVAYMWHVDSNVKKITLDAENKNFYFKDDVLYSKIYCKSVFDKTFKKLKWELYEDERERVVWRTSVGTTAVTGILKYAAEGLTLKVGEKININPEKIKGYKYKSESSKTAKINSNGVVTGVKEGETILYARKDDKILNIKVTVIPGDKKSGNGIQKYAQKGLTLKVKEKININPEKIKGYKYKSKNSKIAKVNSNGVITGVKEGKTCILATKGKEKLSINVKVKKRQSVVKITAS